MDESADRTLVQQLAAVIAWELGAQAGVSRSPEQLPTLVADSVLDYFDVQLKPGVTLPST